MISRGRIPLQPFQTALVEGLHIPIRFREKPIPARLIGRYREFVMHSIDRLAAGNDQAREKLRHMLTLRFIGKQVREVGTHLGYDPWNLDDRWHDEYLPTLCAPSLARDHLPSFLTAA